MSEKAPHDTDQPAAAEQTYGVDIDTERLQQLTEAATSQIDIGDGRLRVAQFGKEVQLTDDDRQQLTRVAGRIRQILEPNYQDPAWGKYQETVAAFRVAGSFGFAVHPGTKIPTWCIKGDNDMPVTKVLLDDTNNVIQGAVRERVVQTDTGMEYDGRPAYRGIRVPERIFNTVHWDNTAADLERYATLSDETLRGRPANYLGDSLEGARYMLRDSTPASE